TNEKSYRLYLTELPAPSENGGAGLNLITRHSLPVFVAPAAGHATHELTWKAQDQNDGTLKLQTSNTGTGHAKITKLSLSTPGQEPVAQTGNFYILPGAEREWSIPADRLPAQPGDEVELAITVNGEQVSTRLVLE